MVLGINKNRTKPPPMRNQAVQAVGRTYFVVSMAGMLITSVLAIAAVASGSARGLFKFRLDRCDCLLTSSNKASRTAGASCIYGQDHIEVNIGWKRFVITEAVSTEGCLDDWEGTTDIGSSFGGDFSKKSTKSYGNGATAAADASVGLFVVSAVIAIVMFKTVKMSYEGPGSIYSVGLHYLTLLCLLLSIASGTSSITFWGRIQGKLGNLETSLAGTLYKATIAVCEKDWNDAKEDDFCAESPWNFKVPLYAAVIAIAHVGVMFFTSIWLLTRSAFVEGILDGSVLSSGKIVTPRAVEYEQAVGRALDTTGSQDYENNNALYVGQRSMIRPYPLPSNAREKGKKVVTKAANALVSPLRKMYPSRAGAFARQDSEDINDVGEDGNFPGAAPCMELPRSVYTIEEESPFEDPYSD